jgi:hypothetical protein
MGADASVFVGLCSHVGLTLFFLTNGPPCYTTVARLRERKGKERIGDETRKEEPAAGEQRKNR